MVRLEARLHGSLGLVDHRVHRENRSHAAVNRLWVARWLDLVDRLHRRTMKRLCSLRVHRSVRRPPRARSVGPFDRREPLPRHQGIERLDRSPGWDVGGWRGLAVDDAERIARQVVPDQPSDIGLSSSG
jgi:hypothetical protein